MAGRCGRDARIASAVARRSRCTSWQAATAPSARIASARAAMPGTASSRHASVTIRRRQVDSGAVVRRDDGPATHFAAAQPPVGVHRLTQRQALGLGSDSPRPGERHHLG